MERIRCVREKEREGGEKWERNNDQMGRSLFFPFCGAQQIFVMPLLSLSLSLFLSVGGGGKKEGGLGRGRETIYYLLSALL